MAERDFELDFIVEGEDGEQDSHYKVAGTVYEGREFRAVSNWSYCTPPEPQTYELCRLELNGVNVPYAEWDNHYRVITEELKKEGILCE